MLVLGNTAKSPELAISVAISCASTSASFWFMPLAGIIKGSTANLGRLAACRT